MSTKNKAASGSKLYEIIRGIDFERRNLTSDRQGPTLLRLVKDDKGKYRCYSCTLCERTCPVDCIQINYKAEQPEEPFDVEAAGAAALAAAPPIDRKLLDPIIAGIRSGSGLIEALHSTQEVFGYLPRPALEAIAEEMRLPMSRLYGVASFYTQFRLQPVGKYVIDVCMGTACHVAGAPLVVEAFSQELEIPVGGTTPDGLFTLQTVNCVGACALAPVVRIGDAETYGRMGPTEARRLVRKLRKQEAQR
ncbi:MAG: NAD(P)H-dependent oxidoreductase subunit E [Thermoleophilia bacterium]|nr:NAD(P)H-dependent oxidoreductase subunit E [Thermoleophilia bacterium]